jgi:hypothetical protein
MPKYVIEREVPDAGRLGPEGLHRVAGRSNAVLDQISGRVQWVHSYVTGNHLFCVYNADDEELIREHARIGGFPCNRIHQVSAVIDPVTGE